MASHNCQLALSAFPICSNRHWNYLSFMFEFGYFHLNFISNFIAIPHWMVLELCVEQYHWLLSFPSSVDINGIEFEQGVCWEKKIFITPKTHSCSITTNITKFTTSSSRLNVMLSIANDVNWTTTFISKKSLYNFLLPCYVDFCWILSLTGPRECHAVLCNFFCRNSILDSGLDW